jgi:integrase
MMRYLDESGSMVERSTKEVNRKKAREIAEETERVARKARSGEITQAAVLKTWGDLLERTTGDTLQLATIEQFFRDYLKTKEKAGSAVSTVARYKSVIEGFLAFLPVTRRTATIRSLSPSEIERFRNHELESGKSASTCDFALKVISSVLNTAHRKGLTLTNPALAVDKLNGIVEERLPFTAEQVQELLKFADAEWTGMILFGYFAGIRLNDAANLLWENIDLESGTVTFLEQKTAGRKRKANPSTSIVLHSDILAWLRDQPEGIAKAPLFPNLAGKGSGSAGGLSNSFNVIMDATDIIVATGRKATGKGRTFRKLGFHSLRHSMISSLANVDVSADVRQAMAGHSSDDIHRRYVHLDVSAQRVAVERMPSLRIEEGISL